jgi:hypothetical protein
MKYKFDNIRGPQYIHLVWQSVGLKGNRLQKCLAGLYFAALCSERPIEQLLAFKIVKIQPHPVAFSLRFFKSDELLAEKAVYFPWIDFCW